MQLWRSLPSLGTGSLMGKPHALASPPVLLSGRAAERLARVQHLGAASDRAGLHGAHLAAVVLQRPVTAPVPGAAASGGAAASWQARGWRRDTDSELAVTAGTLHRLCLFHGSFVQARCSPTPASTPNVVLLVQTTTRASLVPGQQPSAARGGAARCAHSGLRR